MREYTRNPLVPPQGYKGDPRKHRRVALAFQGGGFAGGAFAAGAVAALVDDKLLKWKDEKKSAFDTYAIDTFSGTSSGGLVAAVCWSCVFNNALQDKEQALLKSDELKAGCIEDAPKILRAQWLDVAKGVIRKASWSRALLLTDAVARANPIYDYLAQNLRTPLMRKLVKRWIRKYIPVGDPDTKESKLGKAAKERIEALATAKVPSKDLVAARDAVPGLALGAVEIKSGDIKTFTEAEFGIDALTASGSFEEINGKTTIGEKTYLDGAWGQNPPLNDLIEHAVDEIWLFQVCDTRSHEYLSGTTRCSATGTVPGRASRVTSGCEAPGTM